MNTTLARAGLIPGVMLALALQPAMAGGHKAIGPRVEPAVPEEVRAGVTAIVEETAKRWTSQDSEAAQTWVDANPDAWQAWLPQA